MPFVIDLDVDGNVDDIQQIFEDTVRAFRKVGTVSGTISGDLDKNATDVADDNTVVDPTAGPEG